MTNMKLNHLRLIVKSSMLGVLAYSSTVSAEPYECMLVQARPVTAYVQEEVAHRGTFSLGGVIIEGHNFGTSPIVYFGHEQRLAEIVSVTTNDTLDSITLKFPEGTPPGTYKLIIQNTTGPFLDNDGTRNPIFCFGSVTVGIVSKGHGS